jgi:hypothetical protein
LEAKAVPVRLVQAIELGELPLSERLAARINLNTGVDMDWLLRNDVKAPMPRRPFFMKGVTAPTQTHVYVICLLVDAMSRLFAVARKLPRTKARRVLQLAVAEELSKLKKSDANLKAKPMFPTSREVFQYFAEYPAWRDPALEMLDLDYLIRSSEPEEPSKKRQGK